MKSNETVRRSRSCTRRTKRKECKGSKEARKRQERKQTVVSLQNRRALLRVETQLTPCRRQCERRWRWGRAMGRLHERTGKRWARGCMGAGRKRTDSGAVLWCRETLIIRGLFLEKIGHSFSSRSLVRNSVGAKCHDE